MTLFAHHTAFDPIPDEAVPVRGACPCGRDIREAVDDALVGALAHLETGIAILDRRARLLFASAPARRLLDARGLVSCRDGTLRTGSPRETAQLHRLLRQNEVTAAPRRRSMLIGTDGADPILACLVPIAGGEACDEQGDAPAVVLFLTQRRRARPGLADLQLRFGLTRAEACCAREMLQCDGIGAYARRAGISEATARTHLKHVFEKTGARRQAELVRLLLTETPALAACAEAAEDGLGDDG